MFKLLTEDAEQLLKEMLDSDNVKKLIDDKIHALEDQGDTIEHLREVIDELVENRLMMCTFYGGTVHEAKIPISAEKYFVEKERRRLEEEEKRKEKERLEEEARMLEQAKRDKAEREANERKAEEERLKDELRKKEEQLAKEELRMQEELRLKDEARVREEERLKEEAKIKEDSWLKEEARLKVELRMQEEAKLRMEEEMRMRQEAWMKEEIKLKDSLAVTQDNNAIYEVVFNPASSVEEVLAEIKKHVASVNGADKQRLLDLLDETKEIIDECNSTRRMPKRKRFFSELSDCYSKYKWFYGAIVALIGRDGFNLLGE